MIIYDKYGVDGWTKYWDALRRFINAEISREEMEAVVRFYLPKVSVMQSYILCFGIYH